jgi:hypothetical protein
MCDVAAWARRRWLVRSVPCRALRRRTVLGSVIVRRHLWWVPGYGLLAVRMEPASRECFRTITLLR